MGEAELGHEISGRSHTVRITLSQGPKLSATQVMLQLARGNTLELEIESSEWALIEKETICTVGSPIINLP